MNTAQLKAELAKIADRIDTLYATTGRNPSDDDVREVEALLLEADRIKAEIDVREGGAGRRSAPDPLPAVTPSLDGPTPRMRRDAPLAGSLASFRNDLAFMTNDMGGFESAADFLRTVGSGRHDPRLSRVKVDNAMAESVGTEGGFAVPPALTAAFLGGAIIESGLVSRCSLYTTPSNSLMLVGSNMLDHGGGKAASVAMEWVGEGKQITGQTPQLRGLNLVCSKGAALVDVSSELLEDARNADAIIRQVLADATRLALEGTVIAGTGIGQPKGIIGSGAMITVAAEPTQLADTLLLENAVNMLSRMHPSSLKRAIWIASPSAMKALYALSFPVKAANGGIVSGAPQPASFDAQTGEFTFMGLPLLVSESAALLGDVGDLTLCDPSQYALVIRRQVTIAVDTSSLFDHDSVRYRLTIRVAGQPMWSTPMTPKVGLTLSPFVALAAR